MVFRLLKPLCFLLLLAALVSAFSGCRILGGGDDNNAVAGQTISGRIVLPGQASKVLSNVTGNIHNAVNAAVPPLLGIRVWLESLDGSLYPGAVTTDKDGNFVLTDVPAGSFYIVAQSGTYIGRSLVKYAAGDTAAELEINLGTGSVSGYLTDSAGNPLPAGTQIVLWGQPFTITGTNGYFSTPFKLPDDVSSSTLTIAGTTLSNLFSFLAPFAGQPIVIRIKIPAKTDTNHPPSVLVSSPDVRLVTYGQHVDFIATGTDVDKDTLTYVWSVEDSKGTIAANGADPKKATWTAPSTGSGIATVTITVTDGKGGVGVAQVPMSLPGTTYPLTVSVKPSATGTVTKSPDATTYAHGTNVVLTAVPATGYLFTGWTGGVTSSENPVTVPMTSAVSAVTANFAQMNLGWNNGNVTYNQVGTQVTLTGIASPGYLLSGWLSDLAAARGNATPKAFALTGNTNVFGTFSKCFTSVELGKYWWIDSNGALTYKTAEVAPSISIRAGGGYNPPGPTDSAYAAWDVYQYTGVGVKSDGQIERSGELSSISSNEGYTDFSVNLPTDGGYADVSIGDYSAYALKTDGSIKAWGRMESYNLSGPADADNSNIISIAKHGAPIAIKKDGTLITWNPLKLVADGEDCGNVSTAIPVDAQGSPFVSVSGSNGGTDQFFAALKSDETLVIWQNDHSGIRYSTAIYNSGLVAVVMSQTNVYGLTKNGAMVIYELSEPSWIPVSSTSLNGEIGNTPVAAFDINGNVGTFLLRDGVTVKSVDLRN